MLLALIALILVRDYGGLEDEEEEEGNFDSYFYKCFLTILVLTFDTSVSQ